MPILKYVKAVRSKGRSYHYFNTGKSDNGKLIYVKLPPFGTPQFATSYATLLGHRNRVPEVVEAEELSLSDLIKLYEKSQKFRSLAASSRSEEHTPELPSLMRTSYAVFCLT